MDPDPGKNLKADPGVKGKIFLVLTFQMILNNLKTKLKKKGFSAPNCLKWTIKTQKKHMLPFSPDVKMIQEFFFSF